MPPRIPDAYSGDGNMAEENRLDPARLERIERRLRVLEDAEAIRNLKARYAEFCDSQYDADGIAMLFTEDALWESPGLGRFEGRQAIRNFFRGASAIFSFAIHYSLNGHIEVAWAHPIGGCALPALRNRRRAQGR